MDEATDSQMKATIDTTTARPSVGCDALVRRLDAIVTLGVPVRVRIEGLKRLASIPPIGPAILAKCIEVLECRAEKKRYWPLLDLLLVERGIAEQCFPDAPVTVEAYMRNPPEWLATSPVTCPPERRACARRVKD